MNVLRFVMMPSEVISNPDGSLTVDLSFTVLSVALAVHVTVLAYFCCDTAYCDIL